MKESCKQVVQIPVPTAPPSKPHDSATSASRFQSQKSDGTPAHSLSGTPKIPSLKSEQYARKEESNNKAIATGDNKRKDHDLSSSSMIFCT
uniref:Uncharacterized protein n=1 Tax=Parascaris equorum TaxID=6256 RepID=A0A914RT45_PAREQ